MVMAREVEGWKGAVIGRRVNDGTGRGRWS
jgi:hypothetical protein